MRRSSHPLVNSALFLGIIIIAVGVGWFMAHRFSKTSDHGFNGASYEAFVPEKQEVHLYFGGLQGRYLTAERRVIEQPADRTAFGRRIMTALLDGPQKGAAPILPREAGLRSFHILDDGVAYVDFNRGSFDHHPKGVESESLSIFSIVNSLVYNVEGVRSVKILIDGQEAFTLAGHIDLSQPFQANMLWVR